MPILNNQDSDESLMERLKHTGAHEAFAVLVNRHSRRFYAAAYRHVFDKADAEDIVQEAFLRIWNNPSSWKAEKATRFTTWFYRIVLNLCHDHNRKKRPVAIGDDVEIAAEGAATPLETHEARQKQKAIDRAIRGLPARQQTALNLCFYEGLSNKDAAQVMDVSVKGVESLLMRAKAGLRERLKPWIDQGRTDEQDQEEVRS